MKKIFTEMSSWSQLFFLWLFFVVGLFISSLLVVMLAFFFIEGGNIYDIASLLAESPDYLRISQLVQQVLLFFIPACFCAYLFNKNTSSYLKINQKPPINQTTFAVFLIFTIQPFISFTSYYNRHMKLPEFMSGVEVWFQNSENAAMMMLERLLAGNSIETLVFNLFIVAVVAAIVEEFFFRGVLQQIINKITNNYHWAIWITAFIFSAVHMQFYGFVPRLLLGALLGYLFVFSGSLWVPIIVHFINNAAGVLLYYFYKGTPQYESIENIGAKDMWWTAVLSFVLTAIILYYMSREYTRKSKNIYSDLWN